MVDFNPDNVSAGNTLKLTIDSSEISSDLTDFPLTVMLDSSVDLHTPIFDELNADGNDEYTTLFIDAENSLITDSSSEEKTITTVGDAAIVDVSADGMFFDNAIQFDGTGDYLSAPYSSDFDVSSGRWCLDFWCDPAVANTEYILIGNNQGSSPYAGWFLRVLPSNVLSINSNNNVTILNGTATLNAPGQWTHIALSSDGTTLRLFVNGVLDAYTTTGMQVYSGQPLSIGTLSPIYSVSQFAGNMSQIRFSSGTTRYTETFTVPSSKYLPLRNKRISIEADNVQCPIEIESWFGKGRQFTYADSDPIAHWTFDNLSGTSVLNEIPGGGTLSAASWAQTTGKFDFGYSQTDTAYPISLPADIAFKSISMWVRRTNLANYSVMLCNASGQRLVAFQPLGSGNWLYFFNGAVGPNSTLSVSDTDWHHLVIVEGSDSNKHWLYLDGVKDTAEKVSNLAGVFKFLSRPSSSTGQENCDLDNVQVYDYVLTDEEVTTLYLSRRIHRAVLHVKVPAVSSSTDAELVLSWDKDQLDNDPYVGDIGSTPGQTVWDSNFVAVLHMTQDPSAGVFCITDSTANNNHASSHGSMTADDLVDGLYGRAIDFDGVDDRFYLDHSSSLDITEAITIESMLYTDVSKNMGIVSKGAFDNSLWSATTYTTNVNTSSNVTALLIAPTPIYSSTPPPVMSDWQVTAHTYDRSNIIGYIDGVAGTPVAYAAAIPSNTSYVKIGSYNLATYMFSGMISEIRISNIARSEDWIKLTKLSLNNELITWDLGAVFNPGDIPTSNQLLLTLGSSVLTEDLVNFPLTVYLDSSNALHAPIFEDLNTNYKRISITAETFVETGTLDNDSVKLLIPSDTTDGSVTFEDLSDEENTVTAAGNVHHETDQVLFDDSSIYFDGSGDYLLTDKSVVTGIGTDEFTFEAWVYPLTTGTTRAVFGMYKDNNSRFLINITNAGALEVYTTATGHTSTDGDISDNAWSHIAVTRDSDGNIHAFVDGVSVITSFADSYNFAALTDSFRVGTRNYSGAMGLYYKGYISDICVSDVARWTEDFTPLDKPLIEDYTGYVKTTSAANGVQCPIEVEFWDMPVAETEKVRTDVTYTNESSYYNTSHRADKCFDGLVGAAQYWATSVANPQWVSWGYDDVLDGPLSKYSLQCNSIPEPLRMPKDWTLSGSLDNTNWDVIHTVTGETGWSGSEVREYTPDVITTAYKYYRIDISANNGDVWTIIAEIGVFYTAPGLAVLHTRVPVVSSSTDAELVLFWDETQLDNTNYVGDTSDTIAQTVWDADFVVVYHLAQDPTGGTDCVLDSTSNSNHATPSGMLTSDLVTNFVTGVRALYFDRVDNILTMPAGTTLLPDPTDFTVEVSAILDLEAAGTTIPHRLFSIDTTTLSGAYAGFGVDNGKLSMLSYDGSFNQIDGPLYPVGTNFISTLTKDSSLFTLFQDGVAHGTTMTVTPTALGATPGYISYDYSGSSNNRLWEGAINEFRLSKVVRSADWIKLTKLSLSDELTTWSIVSDSGILLAQLLQEYDLSVDVFLVIMNQTYDIQYTILAELEQLYTESIVAELKQLYGDADVLLALLYQHYGDAVTPRALLKQRYGDMNPVLVELLQSYALNESVLSILRQKYSLTSPLDPGTLFQRYEILGKDHYLAILDQLYSLHPDSSDLLVNVPVVYVTIAGNRVELLSVDYDYDIDMYCGSFTLQLASAGDWLGVADSDPVVLHVNGLEHRGIVVAKSDSKSVRQRTYTVEARSPAVQLDFPFATAITDNFVVEGTASVIVEAMAALEGLTTTWHLDSDPPLTDTDISVTGNSPLAAIRNIVNELGGRVQSLPDGSIHLIKRHKVNTNNYSVAAVTYELTTGLDFTILNTNTDKRSGFNAFSIASDSTDTGYSLTQERVTPGHVDIFATKVPWSGEPVILKTSELTNVTIVPEDILITPLGMQEPMVENVEVEIVGGSGSVSEPCYGEVTWDYGTRINLGDITITEDGTVTTAVAGESMVLITYKTRHWMWETFGTDAENVQFILETT